MRAAKRRWREANPEKQQEYSRRWREANPDKVREAARRWKSENLEKERERNRRWREANPEKQQEAIRRWREANPEKGREATRRWREANPERAREYGRQWSKANPEAVAAKNSRRRSRLRVGLSTEDVRESVEWRKKIKDNPCFYCGAPGEHDDHYMPLARGGTDHWWNLVRACATCNLSKNAKCGDCFIAGVACTHAD